MIRGLCHVRMNIFVTICSRDVVLTNAARIASQKGLCNSLTGGRRSAIFKVVSALHARISRPSIGPGSCSWRLTKRVYYSAMLRTADEVLQPRIRDDRREIKKPKQESVVGGRHPTFPTQTPCPRAAWTILIPARTRGEPMPENHPTRAKKLANPHSDSFDLLPRPS